MNGLSTGEQKQALHHRMGALPHRSPPRIHGPLTLCRLTTTSLADHQLSVTSPRSIGRRRACAQTNSAQQLEVRE